MTIQPDAGDPTAGMTGTRRASRRRRRRRRLLILLLIGLSALPSVATSYISITLFGERALVSSDAWAPMPLDVQAEPDMLIQVTGMLPGDEHHGALAVANVGADTLRYAMVSSSDTDRHGLAAVLRATIRAEGSGCAAFNGALLFDGPLVGSGFGDPTSGQQLGDRLLAAGLREHICVRVRLPIDAGNRFQRSATSMSFTVIAEHAAGTP
jgi:hypothetical protein